MQVSAGEFIGKLRDRLAVKLETDDEPTSIISSVMAAFDRSCVEVLVDEHNEKKELTSGQKAARTRKANREKRQALGAHPLTQQANGAEKAVGGE